MNLRTEFFLKIFSGLEILTIEKKPCIILDEMQKHSGICDIIDYN